MTDGVSGIVVTGVAALRALAGTDLGTGPWMEITQERVNCFADATDDHQWIHVDTERAKDGPFGGTVAHGYLTLALVVPLFDGLFEVRGVSMGVNYGLDRVRFPSPVRVGARIRLQATVASVEDVAGGAVQATYDFRIEVEGSDKPACVARSLARYYP